MLQNVNRFTLINHVLFNSDNVTVQAEDAKLTPDESSRGKLIDLNPECLSSVCQKIITSLSLLFGKKIGYLSNENNSIKKFVLFDQSLQKELGELPDNTSLLLQEQGSKITAIFKVIILDNQGTTPVVPTPSQQPATVQQPNEPSSIPPEPAIRQPCKPVVFDSNKVKTDNSTKGNLRLNSYRADYGDGPVMDFPVYDRHCDGCNGETLISLLDKDYYYPANRIHILEGQPAMIVAESPKGGKDYRTHPLEDGRIYKGHSGLYYEMVWKEKPPLLISAASPYQVYSDIQELDRDTFDFLAPGESDTFTMTNGEELTVTCLPQEKESTSPIEIRTLKLTVGKEERIIQHYFFKNSFEYGTVGNFCKSAFLHTRKLVDHLQELGSFENVIINCNTGKDRSASLIMWIILFKAMKEGSLTQEEITLDLLEKIAKSVEAQSTKGGLTDAFDKTIKGVNFPNDKSLQEYLTNSLAADIDNVL